MFVRDAKAHCPHLVIFPYNFEAYEEVRSKIYVGASNFHVQMDCPLAKKVACLLLSSLVYLLIFYPPFFCFVLNSCSVIGSV